MNYREISGLLLRMSLDIGGPVRAVEDPGSNVTWLSVDRVGSFIAVEDTQELDITIRRGEDLTPLERLTVSFENVTRFLIMEMLDRALCEAAGRIIEQSTGGLRAMRPSGMPGSEQPDPRSVSSVDPHKTQKLKYANTTKLIGADHLGGNKPQS